jgi:hypothetical protein
MSNVTSIVMMTVHRGPDELADLGFVPIPEVTYGYYFEGKISNDGRVEGLIERLKTLEWWDAQYAEVHLHLLWTDDYTGQDDSMAGRVSPYSANHETIIIPKRGR